MDESQKILTGVAESHAATETALIVAGGPAHVERYHALVLVPDIHGPVEFFAARPYLVARKKIFPVDPELVQGGVELIVRAEKGDQSVRRFFIDDSRSFEFLFGRVAAVSENKDA